MTLTPRLPHLWKEVVMCTLQQWLLQISHPAPTPRALGLSQPDTEQSKNLDAIVLTSQKGELQLHHRGLDAKAVLLHMVRRQTMRR